MPRKSCPFPCKFLLAAAGLCLGTLPLPAGADDAPIRFGEPELHPQKRLPAIAGSRALVFIGGFGDEVSGIMAMAGELLPPLDRSIPEQRAYYWFSEGGLDAEAMPRRIAEDIRAYLALNPQADIVLIGHSMGAATAVRCLAKHLRRTGEGRFYLLTLDPVDRSTLPDRPAAVHWWGNAYVVHSQSPRDFVPELGGRWNACAGADLNLRFDGRWPEMRGRYPIHDDAMGMLLGSPGGKGGQVSLLDSLRGALKAAQGATPKAPSSRASQRERASSATSIHAMTQPART